MDIAKAVNERLTASMEASAREFVPVVFRTRDGEL